MKKTVVLILAIILVFCGCEKGETEKDKPKEEAGAANRYINGVWISCFELDGMLNGDFLSLYEDAVSKCRQAGITDLFVHTVPFCDTYGELTFYPKRESAANKEYDVLEKAVEITHNAGLKFHAWINPYRVKTSDADFSSLPNGSAAKVWQNSRNVCVFGGIYLNPAEIEVRKQIIGAVREIITKYNVDGVHLDDYFYPTSDPSFDAESFSLYRQNTKNALSLENWRRENVNALISGIYTAVKFQNKEIAFSVSPAASTEKNYNEYYADIKCWCENGCVDYIIPQLYFGFCYPDNRFCFENLLKEWKETVNGTETKLLIGLAPYKIETEQKPDCEEWNDPNVLIKETEICLNDASVSGEVYFSFETLFSENNANKTALNGIKRLVDSFREK